MANGILVVETCPSSAAVTSEYHKWYDEVHLPEMLGIDGFVSVRRLESMDGPSFVALYEIDTDVETARANLQAALASGSMSTPVGVQLDPPPTSRYFREIGALSR